MGRLSGHREGSLPNSRPASTMTEYPLPPLAGLPPLIALTAPTSRQVYSGLYFMSRSVVGCAVLIAETKLPALGAMRLMPARENPAALSSNAFRSLSWLVIVELVVVAASRVVMMLWAGARWGAWNSLTEP